MDIRYNELNTAFMKINAIHLVNRRYCHFNSIKNFILYFEQLEEGKKKDEIYLLLKDYLYNIENVQITDRNMSLEMYNKYIQPIGQYYHKRLGFTLFTRWSTNIIIILLANFLLVTMFKFNLYVIFIIVLLDSVYLYKMIQKQVQKKTYGFMW